MVRERAVSPRRPAKSQVLLPRNAPNDLERITICACQPAGPTTKGPVWPVDGAPPQALLDAVKDQRVNLLNVLGIVHCMSDSFVDDGEDRAPEVSAAFALLEQEIQRVVAGLDEVSLHDAMSSSDAMSPMVPPRPNPERLHSKLTR